MHEEFNLKDERADGVPASRRRRGHVARQGYLERRGLAILALAAMLCGAGFVYGQNQKNKKKDKDKDAEASASLASMLPEDRAVDLLVSQMLGAWQAGDAEGMHKFYGDDITVISGAWEPPVFGWTNYARAYQAQIGRTTGTRLERTNSYTKVMGDTALVTYQWQFTGNVDEKPVRAFGHATLVLQKRAGNWLIVLNHTSIIPTDDPPPNAQPLASGAAASSLTPGAR